MPKTLAGKLPFSPMATPRHRRGARLALALGILLVLATLGAVLAGWPAALLETRLGDACDAGERACNVDLPGGGRVAFDLVPRPLPGSAPVRIQVEVQGLAPRRLDVSMVGVAMNMAETRTELVSTGSGRYEGELTLPVCSSGPMDWRADVRIQGWWSSTILPFRFRSGSP